MRKLFKKLIIVKSYWIGQFCVSMAMLSFPSDSLAQQIVVGPNVYVSGEHRDLVHNEVMIGASATDANLLVGCSMAYPVSNFRVFPAIHRWSIAYTSVDGGRSWKPTAMDRGPGSGDPVCIYGLDNAAYYIAIAFAAKPRRLSVYRSDDGGRTWLEPTVVPNVIDRPAMAIDRTGGKYHGRIYIPFNADRSVQGIDGGKPVTALTLARSKDGGATFDMPASRAFLDRSSIVGWPLGAAVLSDGTLIILYSKGLESDGSPNSPEAKLMVLTSSDGGETLNPGAQVGEIYGTGLDDISNFAVDELSEEFKDRLYAVWSSARSGRGEIFLSYSADKGKTWSTPRTINDDRPWRDTTGPDHVMPQVAVNKDGVVGVMWYDRRDSPDNLGYYARFSASLDGGETWLPSVRVSAEPMAFREAEPWAYSMSVNDGDRAGHTPLSLKVSRDFWATGGHTSGLTAGADGRFHAFWVDNRTGLSQVWTAAVVVNGSAARNGGRDLRELTDISDSVTLELENAVYNKVDSTLVVTARLKNLSRENLRTPVKARVIELRSAVAALEIVGADNSLNGEGAVWDFSSLLPKGGLLPDSVSAPRRLIFKLSDLRPFRQGDKLRMGLVDLKTRILAAGKR